MSPRRPRLGGWFFRLALHALPAPFRDRHAAEMQRTFEDRQDDLLDRGRGWALPGFWVRETASAAWTGVRLHGMARASARQAGAITGRRSLVDDVTQDVRGGLRMLWRGPGFSLTAIAILALGIGATAAIFTAVDRVLLQDLTYLEPDRLVALWESNPDMGWAPEDETQVAPANALDWREQVAAFDDLGMFSEFPMDVVLTGRGEPLALMAGQVTGNWFSLVGVQPLMGRGFTWEETWSEADRVTVLTHGLWQGTFGGDPDIVGRTIVVDGNAFEVVGVLPVGYRHPVEPVQLFVPYRWDPANRQAVWFRRAHLARGVARLSEGTTLAEARVQLESVASRLEQDYPETNTHMGAGLTPLHRHLTGDSRQPLFFLLGAVAILLLLACVNVGNLLLVRAVGRRREMAVRSALGAGRWRLVRQLYTESAILSVAGGLAGFALCALALRVFAVFAPPSMPDLASGAWDSRTLLFTVGVTVACALLFGAIPALRGTGGGAVEGLQEGARGGTAGARALRAVGVLVSAEVALALLLVLGAGLLARSLWALRNVDAGFDGAGVVTFALEPNSTYDTGEKVIALYQEMEAAVAALPGVREAGAVRKLPLTGRSWSSGFSVEGRAPTDDFVEIVHREATAGYFQTLDVPLLEGRLFSTTDVGDAPVAVVLNESMARVAFPGESPVGRRISFDRRPDESSFWYTIVGVVGDERFLPREEPMPEVIAHAYQDPPGAVRYVARVEGDPMSIVAAAREALRRIDPDLVFTEIRTMDQVRSTALLRERFLTALLGVFASVALLLAAVGVYGVSAQMARRRTREIGIRMALGADAGQVMGMVVRRGMGLTLLGLAAGLAAALAVARLMAGLLYGVEPVDGVTFVLVPVLLALAALLACAGPARRATRVDPVTALRTE